MNDERIIVKAPFIKAVGACFMTFKRCCNRLLSERSFDLSMEQIMVLALLEEEEGLHLTQLADKCDRDKTTITRMVDGLEKRNLVVRVPNKTDSRQKLIYLTHLAKEKLMALIPLADEIQGIALAGINPDHLKFTQDLLEKVTQNLIENKILSTGNCVCNIHKGKK
jgi:DNA-binding MarR family transcriptional regulator